MSVLDKILYGLQVAGIGLVVVFTGLGILIACIYIMAAIFRKINARKEAKAQAAVAASRPAPQPAPAPAPVQEEAVDDPELIAVIAAALAAFDDSGKAFVVRKVRRVSGWNRTARAEQVYRF